MPSNMAQALITEKNGMRKMGFITLERNTFKKSLVSLRKAKPVLMVFSPPPPLSLSLLCLGKKECLVQHLISYPFFQRFLENMK